MNNIYLTGFMSSGKTVVSKELAKLTGMSLFDTDDMIEIKYGLKIKDIFAQHGEEYFREAESEILNEVSAFENSVISTGGGIILNADNRQVMRKTGTVVALLPDFSVIESRLGTARKTRPLLMEETEKIRKRFFDRLPLYKDCDIEIKPETNSSPKDIAKEIIKLLRR